MKCWKEIVAFLLVIAASVYAFPALWFSEGNIKVPLNANPNMNIFSHMLDDGLKPYFYAIGLIFVVVSIAFFLFDREEALATSADPALEAQLEEKSH